MKFRLLEEKFSIIWEIAFKSHILCIIASLRGNVVKCIFLAGWGVSCLRVTAAWGDTFSGNWLSEGPIGGDIAELVIHPLYPDLLFAGTDDGILYRSDNGGRKWPQLICAKATKRLI